VAPPTKVSQAVNVELDRSSKLRPFLPRLTIRWLCEEPDLRAKALEGTVVFVDISGFTKMSERLARHGRVGAEEVTDVVGFVFRRLLATAYANGGGLIKFGGDALLLWFAGEEHASDGVAAAIGMRQTLKEMGPIDTTAGKVRLRMSVGVHSGTFHFFLVGDRHRELLLTGPAASRVVSMEGTADAGEIVISPETAARIPRELQSGGKGEGMLLRRNLRLQADDGAFVPKPQEVPAEVDLEEGLPLALREAALSAYREPEHRRVTIGFIHFDGLDELIEERPLPEVTAALDTLVSAAQRACEAHDVTFLGTDVDKDGGKLILVGGAPTATGDDEALTLAALRAIQATELDIPIRVGVNTGPVFAGEVGPSYRRTYTVMGDAVNLAARVMAKAEPGQILASQAVLDASSVVFETEQLEPFLVKGKTLPVYASVIGEPRGAKTVDEHMLLPLIGRDFETAILQRAVRAALEGEGSLVEVVGPPGIGKTRLFGELRATAGEMRQLTAACDVYSALTPYAVMRPLLMQVLELPPDADSDAITSRLMQTIWNRAPELAPWLPLIGVAIDLELPSTPEVDALGEEFRRPKLNEVVATFMARALREPTLIGIEDSHWMDEPSGDVFRALSRDITERPWLIAVMRRDEATGFAPPTSEATVSIRPEWLSEEQVVELLIAATEESPLRPQEMSALAHRSGGSPLFLQELLRATRTAGTSEGLPDTVDALVTSQIDRLSTHDRQVLRHASVLGMQFEAAFVQRLLERTIPIGPAVWQRLGEFLVEEEPGVFRFRHALMRDAAYEGLPFRRRRELHARAGNMLLGAGAEVEHAAPLLSLHFHAAQRWHETWEYSTMAGRAARSKGANLEAAVFFGRAIEAGRRLRIAPSDLAEVWAELGDARLRVNEFPASTAAYGEARALVRGDVMAEAEFLRRAAFVPIRASSYTSCLRVVRKAMRLLEPPAAPEAELLHVKLRALEAAVRVSQGRHEEAERLCRRLIADAERVDEKHSLGYGLQLLDFSLSDRGLVGEASHSARALEIFRQLGDDASVAEVMSNMGAYAYERGEWDTALERFGEARAVRLRIGDEAEAAICTCNIAEILLDQGRAEEAAPLLRDALRVARAAHHSLVEGAALMLVGRVAVREGRFADGDEAFKAAGELFEAIGSTYQLHELDAWVAEGLVRRGEPRAALSHAVDGLERARQLGDLPIRVPMLHRVIGAAHLASGNQEEARRSLLKSLELARLRGADYDTALALRELADLDAAEGIVTETTALAEASRILGRLGVQDAPLLAGLVQAA
jgi:class 3 adenylate cyclase/tetratricopeptide (TPR) repeat protein